MSIRWSIEDGGQETQPPNLTKSKQVIQPLAIGQASTILDPYIHRHKSKEDLMITIVVLDLSVFVLLYPSVSQVVELD